eukprot:GEMP01023683.1.p1 GENE.GEMP01023683.1~~GEMP01023683.1.p1  ORF type:complete len:319 (+),score=46.75 GEMP01023683.1:32-958(+)
MRVWLSNLTPDTNIDELLTKLEVEGFRTVNDLQLLREEDLKEMGVSICVRRKIIRELTQLNQVKMEANNEPKFTTGTLTILNSPLDAPRIDVESTLASSEPESGNFESFATSRSNDVFGEPNISELQSAVHRLITCLGENPQRDGLLRTPKRVADALLYMTGGYDSNLQALVNGAIFDENHGEMVLVRDIEIFSLCEHHLLPFFGKIHIAYIPDGRVLGLSKLARIAQMFARRLQVQERLTRQVAEAVLNVLQPRGVAVVCEATHGCVVMRGVEKSASTTVTSCLRGEFLTDDRLRQEFFLHVHSKSR